MKGGFSDTTLGGRFEVIRGLDVRVRSTPEQVDAERIDERVMDGP